jgi:tetratricopeptide (TPR) repeat protein
MDSQRGISPLLQNLPFLPESMTRLALPFFLPVTPVFTPLITFLGICIAAFTVALLFLKRKNMVPSLVFIGIIWFLVFSAPNMFVRLASADDNFEYLLHRIYLPSVGLLIMLSGIISPDFILSFKKRSGQILSIILIILIVTNFLQQKKYHDAHSFWTSSINYAPERSWFYFQYGRYFFKQKEIEQYEKLILRADSLSSYPSFHYQLAMIYFSEYKDYDKAYKYFMSSLSHKGYGEEKAARTNFVLFCIESSFDLFKKNKIDEAIERCQLGLNIDPDNATAAYNLGIYYVTLGNKQEAVRFWELSIANDPDLSEPYKSLAIYYLYDRKDTNRAKSFNKKYESLTGIKAIPAI